MFGVSQENKRYYAWEDQKVVHKQNKRGATRQQAQEQMRPIVWTKRFRLTNLDRLDERVINVPNISHLKYIIQTLCLFTCLYDAGGYPTHRCRIPVYASVVESAPYQDVEGNQRFDSCVVYENYSSATNQTIPCPLGWEFEHDSFTITEQVYVFTILPVARSYKNPGPQENDAEK